MGASGVVYLAENPDPDRKVAVNLLRPEGLLFTELRQRFEREAEILRQLRHPHIAEILDAGEHYGLPYIVSKYYEGLSLQQLIPSHGPFDPQLGPIHAIAVTPDETKLAIGDVATPANGDVSRVYLFDLRTGEFLQTLHDHRVHRFFSGRAS